MVGKYEPRNDVKMVRRENGETTVGSTMLVGWLVVLKFNATLSLSQTTNLRLFQTERVCRRQFQIW